MSKGIRYDALLVRALAAELNERLGDRRIRVLRFSTVERTVTIGLRDETLVWDLHPDRGWITIEHRTLRGGGIAMPAGARIGRITAPPDERLVDITIDGEDDNGGHVRRVVIELFGTHRNAIALAAAGTVRAVLRPRPRAERVLAVTQQYTPLPPSRRLGTDRPPSLVEWRAVLDVAEDERHAALLSHFAYTSPLNARWLLAGGDLAAGYDRYVTLVRAESEAWVLAPDSTPQPYPARLD
ncbi:MAG: NFACT family protein, partial [Longimicrobiales bacterium]